MARKIEKSEAKEGGKSRLFLSILETIFIVEARAGEVKIVKKWDFSSLLHPIFRSKEGKKERKSDKKREWTRSVGEQKKS